MPPFEAFGRPRSSNSGVDAFVGDDLRRVLASPDGSGAAGAERGRPIRATLAARYVARVTLHEAIVDVLPRVSDLQHLGPALLRHLQQFPSIANGLSRTEQQALEAVGSGITRLRDVYVSAHHNREEAIFMGDAAFLVHIAALLRSPRPLLSRAVDPLRVADLRPPGLSLDDEVSLTDDGRRVLAGALDRVRTCGINRWLGGVELAGNGPLWRWDAARQAMRRA